ncbi:MAG: Fic family protein [Bacteroidales bacterium]|nr:Fic family protein [Bacteroidales bacterium]
MYLHEYENWWNFTFDTSKIMNRLAAVRAMQGRLLGELSSMGFSLQNEAQLTNISIEIVKSSEIEGEMLNMEQVRSSVAQRLGIPTAGLVRTSRYVDGVVEMMLDATHDYLKPLTDERLFGWHNVLFPNGMSGLYTIDVAKYRTHVMQVVSGPMGFETVHYQAVEPERVPMEMERFIKWFNEDDTCDRVLKAAIAHLWFVTIHPFDDGNGRIARALTEMLLSRADETPRRFYSMSNQIQLDKNRYYDVLESVQRGEGDITEWLLWFLDCLEHSIKATSETLSSVLRKAEFWETHSEMKFNERQKKLINMLFDGFFGKLNTSKWAKIAKCSSDTALNDINDLIGKGILKKNAEGGRSTNYELM